jgi:hypothetical protein
MVLLLVRSTWSLIPYLVQVLYSEGGKASKEHGLTSCLQCSRHLGTPRGITLGCYDSCLWTVSSGSSNRLTQSCSKAQNPHLERLIRKWEYSCREALAQFSQTVNDPCHGENRVLGIRMLTMNYNASRASGAPRAPFYTWRHQLGLGVGQHSLDWGKLGACRRTGGAGSGG